MAPVYTGSVDPAVRAKSTAKATNKATRPAAIKKITIPIDMASARLGSCCCAPMLGDGRGPGGRRLAASWIGALRKDQKEVCVSDNQIGYARLFFLV